MPCRRYRRYKSKPATLDSVTPNGTTLYEKHRQGGMLRLPLQNSRLRHLHTRTHGQLGLPCRCTCRRLAPRYPPRWCVLDHVFAYSPFPPCLRGKSAPIKPPFFSAHPHTLTLVPTAYCARRDWILLKVEHHFT